MLKFVAFLIVLSLCFSGSKLSAQTQERELEDLAMAISKSLHENQRKKITVIDFTDLQGNVNELGRYLAEQVSIGLISGRKSGYGVMDRANLRTILAEQKLSITGLVEPDNAKKLAQFSGVDTIILGTITALTSEYVISVKVLATESAELLGAAKARILKTKDTEALFVTGLVVAPEVTARPAATMVSSSPKESTAKGKLINLLEIERNATQSGDIFVRVESVRLVSDNGRNHMVATIALLNTNQASSVICSVIKAYNSPYSTLTDSQGKVLSAEFESDITGFAANTQWDSKPYGNRPLTEVEPGKSIKITMRYSTSSSGNSGQMRPSPPYRLSFTLGTASEIRDETLQNAKQRGVLIDVVDN